MKVGCHVNKDTLSPRGCDVLVLGSGEGAKSIAWTLARQGKSVVVIERKYIGGSCPNIACLPSKNIIHSAKIASYFYRSGEFGHHQGQLQNQSVGRAGSQTQDG